MQEILRLLAAGQQNGRGHLLFSGNSQNREEWWGMLSSYQGAQISRSQGAQSCVWETWGWRGAGCGSAPQGMGRERTEVGSSRAQSPAAGGGKSCASRLPSGTEKKGILPTASKQGWAGEGADELKARSCSLSLSRSGVKAEDLECNAPAEAGELCR